MLSFASICPHPPIIIPEIGKENLKVVKKTVEAMKVLNEKIKVVKPDTIIIVSPHGPVFPDAFTINLAPTYQGNFEAFGDFTNHFEFKGDLELAYKLRVALFQDFPLNVITQEELDHGTLVPLYYLTQQLKDFSILPMAYSLLDYQTHYNFGQRLREVILSSNKKIAFVASGDLSHRLTFDAPAGYSPQGRVFDNQLIKLIKKKAVKKILTLDKDLIEEAGECGFRSILILLGVLHEINYQPEILSYEGPFGVGYLVTNFRL